MNKLYEVDINSLPYSISTLKNVHNLAEVIRDYLNDIAKDIDTAIIFPRIDELDESLLDVLAYDLHIDWYDDSYNVETKRNVIKTSVNVHRKLGTKYGVETALRAVFPNSKVVPWFETGGEPYYFDVILDTTTSDKPVDYNEISGIVEYYKSLRDNVNKIELTCDVKDKLYIGSFIVQGKTEVIAPLYDNINIGVLNNISVGSCLTNAKKENIYSEIITPAINNDRTNLIVDSVYLSVDAVIGNDIIFKYEEE